MHKKQKINGLGTYGWKVSGHKFQKHDFFLNFLCITAFGKVLDNLLTFLCSAALGKVFK